MALDLDDIIANTAKYELHVGEQTAWITYKPNLISTDKLQSLNANFTSVEDTEPMFQFLSELIVDWEFTKGGQPVPTTPEGIKVIPLPVLRDLLSGIVEEQAAGEVEKPSLAS